jgi:hypothetical protein
MKLGNNSYEVDARCVFVYTQKRKSLLYEVDKYLSEASQKRLNDGSTIAR